MTLKRLTLLRDFRTDKVTLGTLTSPEGALKLETLELPWKNNEPFISCIKTGLYLCKRSKFHKGGYACFELMKVEGRDLIKIHIANYTKDILGCIGLGMSRDENFPAVWRSKVAFGKFMEYLKGEEYFELEIKDA